MGVLSKEYIMQRLNEYANSNAGKERIAQIRRDAFNGKQGGSGLLTRDKAEKILAEICDKFISAVIEVIHSFRFDGVHTSISDMDSEGRVKANISVDEDTLRRESLHYVNSVDGKVKVGHGEGVKDILALFTHGYTITTRRPYGYWVRDNISAEIGNPITRIGALMRRDPNPFLSEFVAKMNIEYGDICEVSLNNKYTNKGGG